MSEQPAAGPPYGMPACRNSWDEVDRLLADWAGQRPDLDFTPVGVVTRLSRLRGYLDAELAGVFARFGLTSADFLVIVSLRRGGPPYRMPQARLMDALGLTSGTVSVRLDRLEKSGIVTPRTRSGQRPRLAGPAHRTRDLSCSTGSRRCTWPTKTGCCPRCRRPNARSWPACCAGCSPRSSRAAPTWRPRSASCSSRPGWRAPAARRSGCPTAPGCSSPRWSRAAPAHQAGIERGDLLTSLDGVEVISSTGLALQLENLLGRRTVRAGLLRGDEELTVRLTMPAAAGG